MHMSESIITVFGGSGFIGRYIVRALAAAGARVRVAVPDPSQALFTAVDGTPGQVAAVRTDVTDPDSVRRALRGSSAAVLSVGVLAERGRRTFQALHVNAATNVAQACAAEGIAQPLLLSALGANADSPSRYARSKAAAEQAWLAACPSGVILRPSVVFGTEDLFFNRLAKLARFYLMPLIGNGITKLQPVYVGDVAAAALRSLQPEHAGHTFSLGGPRVLTLAECAEAAAHYAGRKIVALPFPFFAAEAVGMLTGFLPGAPFTYDQVLLLQSSNVVPEGAPGLAELGINPTTIEAILPEQLHHLRPGGAYDCGRGVQTRNNRWA